MISKTKPALTYSNALFDLTKISPTPSPIGHFTQPHAVFLLLLLQNKKKKPKIECELWAIKRLITITPPNSNITETPSPPDHHLFSLMMMPTFTTQRP
ncbi:hypothetical protein EUGRSUZ_H00005 [Eucalyptus grandis]|uniref:Uncharacterized protein n=2 Tax=Eucalyptus grandis TaxID=71139 RepID=A0ACC3JL77_EUCGR|nr:hypothetical protein EUGRSUZ_H00005 [Eucalyptus grandis]